VVVKPSSLEEDRTLSSKEYLSKIKSKRKKIKRGGGGGEKGESLI